MNDQGPVVAYVRLSRAKEELRNQELAIQRQKEACEAVARRMGWTIVKWFIDPSTSAWQEKVVRKQFEAMLRELPQYAGLVAYDAFRVSRKTASAERLCEVFRANPALRSAFAHGDEVLHTREGQTDFHQQVIYADRESQKMSQRQRSRSAQVRAAGRAWNPGRRAFGLLSGDQSKLDPAEHAAITQAVADIERGKALSVIARQWNDDGILTATGKPWSRTTLKALLVSPRMAGYRMESRRDDQGKDHRQIARDEEGRPIMAVHPPLIPEDVWERLCKLLGERGAKAAARYNGQRTYLLSSHPQCGATVVDDDGEHLCLLPMTGGRRADIGHAYMCPLGHIAVSGPSLDAHVGGAVRERLAELPVSAPATLVWPREAELAAARDKRQRILALDLEPEDIAVMIRQHREVEQALQAEHRAWLRKHPSAPAVAVPVEEWDREMASDHPDLALLRSLVGSVIESLVVMPGKRSPVFDKSRVKIRWRS